MDVGKIRQTRMGFSLIELMVTIAVLAILVAVALPSFTHTIRNNQFQALQDSLLSAFQFARSEAINRNSAVSICPSVNGQSCSGNANWNNGWIIYQDSGAGNSSAIEQILRVERLDVALTISHSGAPADLSPGLFIRYIPQGFAAYSAPIGAQAIRICDPEGNLPGVSIELSPASGHAKAKQGCAG